MRKARKILPGVGIGLLVAAVLAASLWPQRGEVPVQVARVQRKNLVSTVRATGQILPASYTNVLGQGYGRINRILVHEGEFVEPGALLLELDSVQAAATVRADQAALGSAEAGLAAAQAGVASAQAAIAKDEGALRKAQFDWEQGQKLYQAQVIPRVDFESYRSAYQAAQAALDGARAQLAASRSQQARSSRSILQLQAALAHDQDLLNKTVYRAPIPGTVTNIAVRVGEDVIAGVPESEGAYLMTIADMTKLRAQVQVSENDINLLRIGQPVTLEIDAYPGRAFRGQVARVGNQAIVSATGQATSQLQGGASALQATDYLVDISIGNLPAGIRPGMTVSTVIQTASRNNVVAVPFQALVLRPKSEAGRRALPRAAGAGPVEIATAAQPARGGAGTTAAAEQGVFVVRSSRAIFTPVAIGVLGDNAVEVRSGLAPGEQIVVGGYPALQQLHSGMLVKIVPHAQ